MDVNMTRSVAFYVQNGGKFRGFFTINTTSIDAVFLDLCLLYAYNKGFYVINHIKTTKMGFFMVNLCVICREHIEQIYHCSYVKSHFPVFLRPWILNYQ